MRKYGDEGFIALFKALREEALDEDGKEEDVLEEESPEGEDAAVD